MRDFKVFFPDGEIKRFEYDIYEPGSHGIDPFTDPFTSFIRYLHKKSNTSIHGCKITYCDPDGDYVTVDTTQELLECLRLVKGLIKLKIEQRTGNTFYIKAPEKPVEVKPEIKPIELKPIELKPIEIKPKIIHSGIGCDSCGAQNIAGIRYKCKQCSDFDLCETCYPKVGMTHHFGHDFTEMMYPTLSTQVVHENVACDACHKSGIVGKRYKCLNCENYDLCEVCFPLRIQRGLHYNNHVFRTISEPEIKKPPPQIIKPSPIVCRAKE